MPSPVDPAPLPAPLHAPGTDDRPAVGYVIKMFPRLSETFILNEILAREANGERVAIASLRAPVDDRFHPGVTQIRAGIRWIPERSRTAASAWTALAEGHAALPRLAEVLPDLLEVDVDEARQAIAVARWALEERVDHLHAHFATTAATVARLAGALTGLPYSFTAHAKDIFHASVDPAALARNLADAHHVVTVSDHNVEHLTTAFPACRGRVHRVYNGIDPAVGAPGVEVPNDAEGEPTIVAVGRLVEKKGFEHLLAAARLLADRGRPVPVLLAGGGRCEAALRADIDRLGLADQVRLLGPRNQVETHALIRRGTVFAAPFVVADDGDREGLPTVVLEAMALGTPVVTTAVTGIPEAITHDHTGVLVPEADPTALADAIEALLDDPARQAELAANARTLVRRRFDLGAQARALAALRRGGQPADQPTAEPLEVVA